MRVKKVFNNNVVLATDDTGEDVVLLGKGIGYGQRPGQIVAADLIHEVFRPETTAFGTGLPDLLAQLPGEIVMVAEQIARMAKDRLGLTNWQALVFPLADHLTFAVERATSGTHAESPLRWEVATLYSAEHQLGTEAVQVASQELGVSLAEGESVAVALHFVTAQFARGYMAQTVEMTRVIRQCLDLISTTAGACIDPATMNAARFVTHLRYLFIRVEQDSQIDNTEPELLAAIARAHPHSAAIAHKLAFLLEAETGPLTRDEVAYLTLHVQRLLADLELSTPPASAP